MQRTLYHLVYNTPLLSSIDCFFPLGVDTADLVMRSDEKLSSSMYSYIKRIDVNFITPYIKIYLLQKFDY